MPRGRADLARAGRRAGLKFPEGPRIRAGTLFSAKFVELVHPSDPSPARLTAGAVITSESVSTEINTLWRNLAMVLNQVDTAKLQGRDATGTLGCRVVGGSCGGGGRMIEVATTPPASTPTPSTASSTGR